MRRSLAVLAVLLCLLPFRASAEQTWMTVLLDGRKVGTLRIDRDVGPDKVTTSQSLDFRLTRIHTPLMLHTDIRNVESPSGDPLAFYAQTKMSSQDNRIQGESRGDGTFQVAHTVGDLSRVTLLNWPTGASMLEGQRLAFLAHGFRPGTTYRMRSFDAVKQQVATIDVTVVGTEVVDMPLGRETLHHLRQTLASAQGDRTVDLWLDDQANTRRGIAPLLGFRLEMMACDEHCANAPNQDVDLLRAAMIESPRMITSGMRASPMRYLVQVRGSHPTPFIDTDEQSVVDIGDGIYQVDVGFARDASSELPPQPDDTAPNAWVQSDAPEIVSLARQIVGDADSDLQRMRRLRSYMSDFIEEKGLDVGYASALETLKTRRGDCTEHAVMLAALARSLGIPTRVVTGVVYTDRFGGASRVFVPHAWTQAWLGRRWVSFDSAQRRFDASHIALGTGNGDPWRFFSAMSSLGSISIRKATPASSLMDMPAPSSATASTGGSESR